jgi:hypothetical protein
VAKVLLGLKVLQVFKAQLEKLEQRDRQVLMGLQDSKVRLVTSVRLALLESPEPQGCKELLETSEPQVLLALKVQLVLSELRVISDRLVLRGCKEQLANKVRLVTLELRVLLALKGLLV